jgi:hypothetical protein
MSRSRRQSQLHRGRLSDQKRALSVAARRRGAPAKKVAIPEVT